MDKEHYITEGVLEALGDGLLEIDGLAWQNGQKQLLSTGALTAKVLCHRHNTALSPLDKVAARFFRIVRGAERVLSGAYADADAPAWSVFNGHDLERWMLKTLLGMLSSNGLAHGTTVLTGGTDEATLRVLFGRDPWPAECGLYTAAPKGVVEAREASFRCSPIMVEQIVGPEKLCGFRFEMGVTSLLLSLWGRIAGLKDGREYERIVHRPDGILFTDGTKQALVKLIWNAGPSGTIAVARHQGYRAGPPPALPTMSLRRRARSNR